MRGTGRLYSNERTKMEFMLGFILGKKAPPAKNLFPTYRTGYHYFIYGRNMCFHCLVGLILV